MNIQVQKLYSVPDRLVRVNLELCTNGQFVALGVDVDCVPQEIDAFDFDFLHNIFDWKSDFVYDSILHSLEDWVNDRKSLSEHLSHLDTLIRIYGLALPSQCVPIIMQSGAVSREEREKKQREVEAKRPRKLTKEERAALIKRMRDKRNVAAFEQSIQEQAAAGELTGEQYVVAQAMADVTYTVLNVMLAVFILKIFDKLSSMVGEFVPTLKKIKKATEFVTGGVKAVSSVVDQLSNIFTGALKEVGGFFSAMKQYAGLLAAAIMIMAIKLFGFSTDLLRAINLAFRKMNVFSLGDEQLEEAIGDESEIIAQAMIIDDEPIVRLFTRLFSVVCGLSINSFSSTTEVGKTLWGFFKGNDKNEDFVERLLDALEFAASYIIKMFGGDPTHYWVRKKSEWKVWHAQAVAHIEKAMLDENIDHPKFVKQLDEHLKKGYALLKTLQGTSQYLIVARELGKLEQVFEPLRGFVSGSNNYRVDPVWISLLGPPGEGKSLMSIRLLIALLVLSGTCSLEDALKNVYRKPDGKFWSKYKQQEAVVQDDFLQERQVVGAEGNDISMVMKCMSTFGYPLNQAELSEKGNSYFTSKIYLTTTNVGCWNQPASVQITCPEALYRRVTFPYRIRLKDKYRNGKGRLDFDKYQAYLDAHESDTDILKVSPFCFYDVQEWDYSLGEYKGDWIPMVKAVQMWAAEIARRNQAHGKEFSRLQHLMDRKDLDVPVIVQGRFDGHVDVDGKYHRPRLFQGCKLKIEATKYASILKDIEEENNILEQCDLMADQCIQQGLEIHEIRDRILSYINLEESHSIRKKAIFSKWWYETIWKNRFFTKEGGMTLRQYFDIVFRKADMSAASFYASLTPTVKILLNLVAGAVSIAVAISILKAAFKLLKIMLQCVIFALKKTWEIFFGKQEQCVSTEGGTNSVPEIPVNQNYSKIQKNTVVLKSLKTGKSFGNMIGLIGTYYMMPAHFIYAMDEHFEDNDIFQFLPLSKNVDATCTAKQFLSFDRVVKKDQDVCIVDLKDVLPNMVKDIRHFFVDKKLLNLCRPSDLVTHVIYETNSHFAERQLCTRGFSDARPIRNDYGSLRGLMAYAVPSQVGDCGGLVYSSRNENNCLLGMHVAREGVRSGLAFFTPTTKEMIDDMLSHLCSVEAQSDFKTKLIPAPGILGSGVSLKERTDAIVKRAKEQGHEGGFSFIPNPFSTASFTQIRRSYKAAEISEIIGKPPKVPAVLRPTLIGNQIVDPVAEAVLKRMTPVHELTIQQEEELEKASFVAYQKHAQLTRHHPRFVLSFEEAVQGVGSLGGIPRGTSAGYPIEQLFKKDGKKAKRVCFGDDEWDFTSTESQLMKGRVDDLIEKARLTGEVDTYYTDHLKDENLKRSKVESCQSRLIAGAALDNTIAFRRLCGAFIAATFDTKIESGHAVGIISWCEWGKLADYLTSNGVDEESENFLAGDFAEFDLSQLIKACRGIFAYIDRWYANEPNHDYWGPIRLKFLKSIFKTKHVVLGWLICEWLKSLPSGHPFTSIGNCGYNMTSMVYVYYKCTGKWDFWDHCRIITYGDDNVLCVDDETKLLMTPEKMQLHMKSIGLTYTSAYKDRPLVYESLRSCTFLKRGFNKTKNGMCSPLDLNSILWRCYWTKAKPTEEKAELIDKAQEVLYELSLHPKDVWDKHSPWFVSFLSENSMLPRESFCLGHADYDVYQRAALLRSDTKYM
jgi:hypothetical protein